MLNDRQIRTIMRSRVTPWNNDLLQPASLEVTLGDEYQELMSVSLVIGRDVAQYEQHKLPYLLLPDQFILCHTIETFTMPHNIAGKFEGKSSLGRLGLMTHITAGFIDPGFHGQLTLEVKNVGPCALELNPGIKIGQIAFFEVETVDRPYGSDGLNSHYQNSIGVRGYEN